MVHKNADLRMHQYKKQQLCAQENLNKYNFMIDDSTTKHFISPSVK